MKIPDPYWFNFDALCHMSEEICDRHEKEDRYAEYGMSWDEFLATDDAIYGMAKKFLEEMDKEKLKELILMRISDLERNIEYLKECLL